MSNLGRSKNVVSLLLCRIVSNCVATNVQLEFPCSPIVLPQEVFGSQTLVRLSMTEGKIDGKYVISCSNLKSLTLNNVKFTSAHVFKDIILCCISMEELSLSYVGSINTLKLMSMNLCKLHKLRRLFLAEVDVDNMFFTEFASRFPCLKDLSILLCHDYTSIQIASTSLETIVFKPWRIWHEIYSEVEGEPLAVENLMIDAPSSFCSALLIRLFEVFRPNFITHYWLTDKCDGCCFYKNESLDILCMRLMQKPINPNCGIPNQNMFGRFHPKKVKMFGAEWRPCVLKTPLDVSKAPVSKRKIRTFELIWDD